VLSKIFAHNGPPLPTCNFLSSKPHAKVATFQIYGNFFNAHALIHQKIIAGSGCYGHVGWDFSGWSGIAG